MKDSSKWGRKLTPKEIAALKTKPSVTDSDGDGIDDEIDTLPDIPSNGFIDENMPGLILDHGNQPIWIKPGGDIQVGDDKDGSSAVIELLGVELEVEPGTIFEAAFG